MMEYMHQIGVDFTLTSTKKSKFPLTSRAADVVFPNASTVLHVAMKCGLSTSVIFLLTVRDATRQARDGHAPLTLDALADLMRVACAVAVCLQTLDVPISLIRHADAEGQTAEQLISTTMWPMDQFRDAETAKSEVDQAWRAWKEKHKDELRQAKEMEKTVSKLNHAKRMRQPEGEDSPSTESISPSPVSASAVFSTESEATHIWSGA
jgi:hypothetical protein